MDTSNDDLVIPGRDYKSPSSNTNATSQAGVSPTSSDANQKTSADDSELTEKEIVLKKIHDALKKWFGCEPDMERSSSGVVKFKFEHANRYWMIQFPEDFPKAPAKLFCAFSEIGLRRNECSFNIVKPLVNDVNILLSIKNECKRSCDVCKHFTKESLSQSEVNPSPREKLTVTVIELMENISDANQKTSADDSELTEKEIVLKKIHDALKKWFGCEPDMERSSSGVVKFKFEHANRYWMIQFPEDFPKAPAKLFCAFSEIGLRRNECSFNIVKPLVNDVNILLSIKNECKRSCDVCKHFTKESLSQSEVNPSSREKLTVTVIELMENINREIGVDSSNNQLRPDNSYEITFKHGNWFWLIEVPAAYPEKPAKVYKFFHERSSQKFDALVFGDTKCGPVDLNTSELIIKAIYLQCSCTKCFELKTRDKKKSK